MLDNLLTPTVLVDADRMQRNIDGMQSVCDAHGVQLWPHNKTHKMVEVAKRQLAAGAVGLTCAKLSEAEALLPSRPQAIFLAHSLVNPQLAPRLRKLADSVDQLVVACTSEAHCAALEKVLAAAEARLPVMMGVDVGLGREGVRGLEAAVKTADAIRRQPHMELIGAYTHEGHLYAAPPAEADAAVTNVHAQLLQLREAIDPALQLWPGSSVSAKRMATRPGITAVRPGTYVFGDLSLAEITQVMPWDDVAVTVLATVVDRPEPGLALIDAGSKVFSSDKTSTGFIARAWDRRDINVLRCNEEHGYVTGSQVDELQIGERLRFMPAHVCTTINLTNQVTVVSGDDILDTWKVDARGCVQ
jgi:D-serine deaminase-like pyridoxal phosphate-dependent protein